MIVRQECLKDYKSVEALIKKAFEAEEYTDHNEHNLVAKLRLSDAFIEELSLVAEVEGILVGHILFTKIWIGEKVALALAPVSVLPDYQGQGIGSTLINEGHKTARALGYKVIVVLGHEQYYPKFGYVKACDYHIESPFEVPEENYMVLEIEEGALSQFQGRVQYAKEFME